MCDSGTDQTTSSQTQSTSLTGPALNAYNLAFQKATDAANSSYNPATESQVAGFTAPQKQAFQKVEDSQGIANPYIAQSSAYTASGASPVSATQIQHYLDPNTQNLIDDTQHDFDVQNQRQRSGVTGSARLQGSWGGDREAVASALTTEAQSRVQDPILAKMRSDAYAQALSAAQADQQRQLAASGQALAQGTTAQQTNNTDLASLYASGGLQQGQSQKQLDAATANAKAAEAFKYQQPQYLAGITGALGGFGTTTTGNSVSTPAQPNEWLQAAGLGLGALAAIPGLADGGRVDGFADGGTVPYAGVSYIPTMPVGGGFHAPALSMPQAPAAAPGGGLLDHMNDVLGAAKQFKGAGAGIAKIGDALRTNTTSNEGTAFLNPITTTTTPTGLGFLGFADGGTVPDMPDGVTIAGGDDRAGFVGSPVNADRMFETNDVTPAWTAGRAPEIQRAGFSVANSVPGQLGTSVQPGIAQPLPERVLSQAPINQIGTGYTAPVAELSRVEPPAAGGLRYAAQSPSSEKRESLLGQIVSGLGLNIGDVDNDPSLRQAVLATAGDLMAGGAPGGKGLGGFLRPLGHSVQVGQGTFNQREDKRREIALQADHLQAQAAQLALAQAKSPYEIGHLKAQTALTKQQIEAGKVVTIGTTIDQFGNKIEIKGVFNPETQKYDTIGGPSVGSGLPAQIDPGLTGEDALNAIRAISPADANTVKAMIDNKSDPPKGFAASKPYWQRLMSMARQVDGNFDEAKWPARVAAQKKFDSGAWADAKVAYNRAIQHVEELEKSVGELNNSNIPMVNGPYNAIAGRVSANREAAIKRFEIARNAVAGELAKAFKGSGSTSLKEIEDWKHDLDPGMSDKALRGGITKSLDLLYGAMEGVATGYGQALDKQVDPKTFLSPKAKAVMKRLTPNHFGELEGQSLENKAGAPSILDQIMQLPDGPVSVHGKSYMKRGTILTPMDQPAAGG